MKKLLLIFLLLISSIIYSQEGTKQLMPNEVDRLYLEMYCNDGENNLKEFATYGAEEKDRLHIYLKEGETMHFGMQMYTDDNYGGNCETDPEDVWFRIKDPDGNIVYPSNGNEREMFTSGETGYINNYSEAVNGPNGVILNETEITDGYNSETFTANQTGNYYIEFYSNEDDYDGWWGNYRRFALKYFDVTVTRNNNIITNSGEPNVSAGRLWSKNWSLTNTSFTEYPAKVYFYVFTSDEFVNRIQYRMKPFSFNFASNPFGVDNSSSLNVIEKAQSQNGFQIGSDDIAEYKIYLNDPDRNVWETTALPPPKVKVWHEDKLIYDYDYMREPQEEIIELDTLILEKNMPGCDSSSLTLFKIKTNVDGFATILLDIDGNGYSTEGNDRVLHEELKKGYNYILWNFRNDNGTIVSNGPVSISATFYGRGATHFPLYDVETLSGVSTKTKRPFNKLCPTLYWDDSQISDWGDDGGTGSMDETDTTQLIHGNTEIPRVWAFNLDREDENHNGNINTLNSWYNAIDLGRSNINSEVITSDTLCIDGSKPILGDIHVDTTKNDFLYFNSSDFTNKFSDPADNDMENIRIESLPENGTLQLNGSNVFIGQTINIADLDNLSFIPDTDWTGLTTFLWNATNGNKYALEDDTVNIFINTPPNISEINDTTICTDETLEIEFTVNDDDDIHDPEDIDVIAYSNNLEVIPNAGCEVEGEGETRTLTIEPFGIKSGYIIIYLQAYDGVTSIIKEFAVKLSPSLDFTGDTSVCIGSQLELTAEEVGADAYTWEREGTVVGTERTYTDPELYENETGTYTLTVEKGNCVSSRDFTVSIYPIVSFTGDTDLCVGEDLKLSADEETANEYLWERDGYEIGTSKVLSIENVDLDNTGDDYTLYVNKEGCENISDPFSVSVKNPPEQNLELSGDTVEIGENGTVTIFDSEDDIIYRAYKDDEELASGTGTGSAIELIIPPEHLDIGENTIEFTADNGNCWVDLDNKAIVYVNSVPQAVNDTVTFDENNNITLNVLENDSGLEDGNLNLQVSNPPYHGDASSDSQDSIITYEPEQDYFGQDSLIYTVCDVDNDCDSAYVFFNIEYVDDQPTAVDDYITMDEDTDTTLNVLENDYGLDSGLVVNVMSDPNNGYTNLTDDNNVYYEPETDFYGEDQFSYQVEDAEGDNDEAVVYITVENVDDQPVAEDDIATTDEDTPVEIYVLENDEGLGDGVQDVVIKSSPTNGTANVDTYSDEFPVTYEPDPNFNGDDWFEYEVIDVDGQSDYARVDISVTPVNDPVIAVDDTVSLDEDTNIDIPVLDNDTVADGIQELNIETQPEEGSVTILSNNEINYEPDQDYYGEDSFVYEVVDDHGADTDYATVHISVDSIPDDIIAINDEATLDEDTDIDIPVLNNDEVPDGVQNINIQAPSEHGSVTVLSNNKINYEPDPDYNGGDSFVYEVVDNFGDTDDATVSITVEPVDDNVIANDDDATLDEDTNIDIQVLDNDDVPDGVRSLTVVSYPENGYAEVNDDNTIYYEPDPDYNGSDSFIYEVVDDHGGDSDQATVNITVEWVNDVPIAREDNASTNAEEDITVNVLRNDDGLGDGIYDLKIYSPPQNGDATSNPADSTITYLPDAGSEGNDTLVYEVQDSLDQNGETPGEYDRAELIISVGDTNYIPIANNDTIIIDEDNDTTIDVLENDEDLYDGIDYFEIIEDPDHGTVNINNDNTIDYSPDPDYNGSDSFEYEVFDSDGDSDDAIVDITINPVNDIPEAVDDNITIQEDTDTTVNVLKNDNGLGDGIENLQIEEIPGNGIATVNGDSTIHYEPEKDFYGNDQFDYRVTDVDGEEDIATVYVNIESVNDIPEAVDDTITIQEDTDTTVNVLKNDNGLGDGIENLQIEEIPGNGIATVNGDSTIHYEPEKDFYGNDQF
ncbi:MAG: Ig-like domain-containing protein, partial [Bacteroidales bacterium]